MNEQSAAVLEAERIMRPVADLTQMTMTEAKAWLTEYAKEHGDKAALAIWSSQSVQRQPDPNAKPLGRDTRHGTRSPCGYYLHRGY